MKRISTFVLAVALAGLTAGVATADSYGTRVERRDHRQDYRIRDNWRDGDFSRSELLQIRAMQRRIQIMQRRAWADGHFSRYERRQIRQAQNQLDWMIRQFARDDDRRWNHGGRRDNGRWG